MGRRRRRRRKRERSREEKTTQRLDLNPQYPHWVAHSCLELQLQENPMLSSGLHRNLYSFVLMQIPTHPHTPNCFKIKK